MTRLSLAALTTVLTLPAPLAAQADLNDLEMAHVAVTASNIDIAYAHLALAFSDTPEVRGFAESMIADHGAVNAQIVQLAARLGVEAQNNAMSRQLLRDAEQFKRELSGLRGAAFDRAYIENEVRYHRTVNDVVENAFIPSIENAEVKQAFQRALLLFKAHQRHAEEVARIVSG